MLGTKRTLHLPISRITGIEQKYLNGESLDTASVAKRMSWAAHRRTTRHEDEAYCLIGIFDVNVPLLYGEGKRAFQRLQHEIMRTYPEDHTLFAWGKIVNREPSIVHDKDILSGTKRIAWDAEMIREPLLGLLAESPKDFEFSSSLEPLPAASFFYQAHETKPLPARVGKGIRLELPCTSWYTTVCHRPQAGVVQLVESYGLILLCSDGDNGIPSVHLYLHPWGAACYGRAQELVRGPRIERIQSNTFTKSFYCEPERQFEIQAGDFAIRRYRVDYKVWALNVLVSKADRVSPRLAEHIIRPHYYDQYLFALEYIALGPGPQGFAILFGRVECESSHVGSVTIGFLPAIWAGSDILFDKDGVQCWNSSAFLEDTAQLCEFVKTNTSGVWIMDVEPFPRIRIELERVKVEDGVVDLFEIDVTDREKEKKPDWSKLGFPSREEQKRQLQLRPEGEIFSEDV